MMDERALRKHYQNLTNELIDHQIMVTTMESATAGLIASLLTDTEGSSAVFQGAYITYSNEAKVRAGVPADIIDTYGVYSKECAEQMAKCAKEQMGADLSIGITGTFGNIDPANVASSETGKVYVAIFYNEECHLYEESLEPQESRYFYKLAVAEKVLSHLQEILPFGIV